MKPFLAAVLALSMALSLAGCSSDDTTTADTTIQATAPEPAPAPSATQETVNPMDGGTIAYITPSLEVPFWCYVATGVETQASEYGASVVCYDSNNDPDTQYHNMTQAIESQVMAIVISPVDSASCPDALDLAEEAGIPVVVCDVGTDSGTYASYISTDNEGGAKELGEYVANLLEDGDTVAQILLDQGRINGQLRKSGFELGIADKDITQVACLEMSAHVHDEGVAFTKELLKEHPELDAIFIHAEDPTMGAIEALQAAGRTDILVAGFDFSVEYPDAMRQGLMVATAAQQPVLMGSTSVNQLYKALSGRAVESEINLPTLLITKDNIDELEASGGLDTVYVAS